MIRRMKRVSVWILIVVLAIALAGCSGQKATPDKKSEAGTVTNAVDSSANIEESAGDDAAEIHVEENRQTVSPSQAQAGDVVVFGAYEQDRDFSNGQEPIEWLVLNRDGDTLLLVSKKTLDAQPYDLANDSVTWEGCTLRAWLNEDFYNTVFLQEEQKAVLLSDVPADPNPEETTDPGNATQDRIFLLSIAETEQYLSSEEDRKCEPSEYTKAMGVLFSYENLSTWWFRTPGNGDSYAAFYEFDHINYDGKLTDHDDFGVRPALRVNASTLETEMQAAGIDATQRRPLPEVEGRSIDLASLKAAEAGSQVLFGAYEQDNDPENGSEPIEWIVLDKDGSKLLLLSRYSLDNHPFKGASSGSVWSSSTIRGWLNNDFYCRAFTMSEQALIQTSHVTADTNPQYGEVDPGEDTEDQVFLLSVPEVEKYLPADTDRGCLTTVYAGERAKRAGVFTNTAALAWWLRTPGMNGNNISFVKGSSGTLNYDGCMPGSHNVVVRPAIWIDIDQ